MFSAIAVIAFVGSSMANDIANVELEVIDNKCYEVPSKTDGNPCFGMAIKMMDLVEADNGVIDDIVEFNTIYQYYIGACESGLINIE